MDAVTLSAFVHEDVVTNREELMLRALHLQRT